MSNVNKRLDDIEKRLDKIEGNPWNNFPNWPQWPNYPQTTPPNPQCKKCGIELSPIMGYVCYNNPCPSGLRNRSSL